MSSLLPAHANWRSPRAWASLLLFLAVTIWSITRLFFLIDHYSVNTLFWDHWAYYPWLHTRPTFWQMFSYQWGPHRQGIGLVISGWIIAPLTHFNMRAEAFAVGAILCAAVAAALALKYRLFGRLVWHDLVLPLIMLTPAQYDIWAGSPNTSHGAWPLLLILLSCLAWTIKRPAWRYSLVLALNFLAIFTGFGVFLGVVTPGLFLLHLIIAQRRHDRRATTINAVALAIAGASAALFFVRYKPDAASPGFLFPDPRWYLYPHVMALAFAKLAGFTGTGWIPSVAGWIMMALVIATVAVHVGPAVRFQPGGSSRDVVLVILAAFSLLFAANMAIGRICLGLDAAQASRYLPLMAPAFIAVYLQALTTCSAPIRRGAIALIVAVTAFATLTPGHHDRIWLVSDHDRDWMAWYTDGKKRWLYAYMKTRSVELADYYANFQIVSAPPHINAKLKYLKTNKLSFFRHSLPPIDWNGQRDKWGTPHD